MIGKESKKDKEKKDTIAKVSNLLNFVTDAKEKARWHWEDCKEAWREYLRTEPSARTASASTASRRTKNYYPIFWASVKNLLPAYYSRTPNTLAKRLFDSEDPAGKVAAQLLERLSKSLLNKSPLTSAMTHASVEFVLCDKATAKMYCEEVVGLADQQVPVIPNQETGEYMMEDGSLVDMDAEIPQLEDGSLVTTIQTEQIIDYKICILPVNYDDIIHTPSARTWEEITQIGFRFYLTKAQFIKKYGTDKLKDVTFGSSKDDNDRQGGANATDDKEANVVELWEIWDKDTKMVSVVSQYTKTTLIDEYPDPYELKGFFPCAPFVISTKPSKNLYPTPAFVQLKPIIFQLHRIFDRFCKLTSALKRKGIADAQLSDVIAQLKDGTDTELMVAKNYQQILERGGLASAISWFPLQELSNALKETQQTQANFETMFDKLFGVPDVVRGSTNPNETAQAQQQKGEFYNLRTSWDQLQFQEMARCLIEMQVEIALVKMTPEMLKKYMGVQFLDPADQPFVEEALGILTNDQEMDIRVEIETDSMSYMNDKQNQEQRTAAGQIVIQGLQQVAGAENPALTVPIAQVLFSTLRTYNMGKDFENTVADAMKKMQEAANTPPPPPPVDPNVELNQAKIQIEQDKLGLEYQRFQAEQQEKMVDSQLEQMKLQNDANTVNLEMEFKVREAEAKAQQVANDQFIAQSKLELESQVANLKYEIDSQRVQIEASATQNEAQLIILRQQLESTQSEFDKFLKTQDLELRGRELEIEDKKITLSEAEKQQEELRLAQSQQLEVVKMQNARVMQDQKIEHEKEMAKINNRLKKKKIKLGKTETGEWEGTSEDED
jgi:hypothetical protein